MRQKLIRAVLTVALLVMVYRETGPWTVLVLALITIAVELQSWLLLTKWSSAIREAPRPQ